MKIVLITNLKKEFDKKLAGVFVREGYKVFSICDNEIDDVTQLPSDLKEASDVLKKNPGLIDIYIDTSDERSLQDNFNVRTGINDQVMRDLYDANVIRPMAMLEAFYPLLEAGSGKRICYLTSSQASINETQDTNGYGYRMAKAGLHNFLQITRNVLAPKDFTIRVFDPCFPHQPEESVLLNSNDNISSMTAKMAAEAAFNYFTRGRGVERGDKMRDDENNLVFRDAYGRQHAW